MCYLHSDLQIKNFSGVTEEGAMNVSADIDDHMLMGEQKC